MAWAHRFKPPSGIPAYGFSKGDGWGGPARGASLGGPARPFKAGNTTRVSFHKGEGDPTKAEKRRARAAAKETRNKQLLDLICDLALNAEREETQLTACIAALDRLEGKPLKKSRTGNTTASLEELILATQVQKPTVS